MAGPTMKDVNAIIEAGMDPKTGLPIRPGDLPTCIKAEIKKQLRIKDEATAINRFTWYGLPKGINAKDLERLLYYRGQGILFYVKELESFFFLPFALDGTIDIYGRYEEVRPLPFTGVSEAKETKVLSNKAKFITAMKFKPVYDVLDPDDYVDYSEDELEKILSESCVILRDYSEQLSQNNLPRQALNEPILDIMANYIPLMNTALFNSSGVLGMRVNTENEQAEVIAASNAINKAALEGRKYVPVIGSVDFQEMTGGTVAKSEEFLLAMQGVDNYRLGLYGLENGGLFQKKAHILQSEQDLNTQMVDLIMRDSLEYRQNFCSIANSIWGLSIWVEQTQISTPEDDQTPFDDYDTEDSETSENNIEGGTEDE